MEFGRIAPEEIATTDFTLPPDGKQTKIILDGKKAKDPLFYVGCAKWGRKEWKELIYPKKTKEADFLGEYVKHFNSIELNAVFYSIPKEEQILKWKETVDANVKGDFIFCPKFSRTITHIKRLKDTDFLTDEYIKAVSAFGPYLGPCFLQVSDNFGPNNLDVLEAYLKKLPNDLKVFIEVRHKDWFVGEDREQLFAMLAKLGKGAAITDASGRRDCLHMELPTKEVFIRFVGNGGKYLDSDKARVDDWVLRIKSWLDKGLENVYFFLHQHDEADTPLIADYTVEQFNKHLGSDLSRINFIPKSNLLL
ncbi:MAG: DUF72 domain-containing protein [Pedobacter sp.]|nr:MAG: DUF72 domain-containing protein [Pedobacter sp.]